MIHYRYILIEILCIILFLSSTQSYELNEKNIEPLNGNISACLNLPSNNSIDSSIDFGFLGNGTISGNLWIDGEIYKIMEEDINTSGIDQANIILKMYNNVTDTWVEARSNTTTNNTGYYIFESLFAGVYYIIVDITKSPKYNPDILWTCTTPERYEVNLENDNSSKTVDLGYDITE